MRPRHTVASEAQARALGAAGEVLQEKSEALLEEALRDLTSIWRCQKALSEGHKKRVGPRHTVASEAQARALGAAGEVLQEKSEALLEKALRDLTSIWRCQKAVSEGHKKRVRPRHTVASEAQARALGAAGEVLQEKPEALLEEALRDLTSIWRCQKALSEGLKRECGQGTRWLWSTGKGSRCFGRGAARKVWGIAGGGAAGPYKHLKVPKSTFGRS